GHDGDDDAAADSGMAAHSRLAIAGTAYHGGLAGIRTRCIHGGVTVACDGLPSDRTGGRIGSSLAIGISSGMARSARMRRLGSLERPAATALYDPKRQRLRDEAGREQRQHDILRLDLHVPD